MNKKYVSKQIKAARALLGWSQADLMKLTELSEVTIKRAETMSDTVNINKSTLKMIISTFESHGILFIDSPDENSIGVHLRIIREQ